MVLEPRLLLFDEPLSNLDFKLRVQMRFELRDLQRRLGKTSIYVTHDQTEALALSDRIAVLSDGRIEQIGRPSDIYETPETAFVADFIGSSNILEAAVLAKDERGAVARATTGLELAIPPISEDVGERLLLMVRPECIRLVDGRGETPANCIAVEIEDLTYLGEDVQLRVTPRAGGRLLVALKSGKATRDLRRGGAIDLAIDPEDIHLLRK
jgi:ABC-type Fe3+/spermidine/putrescine transport system ATPase subunit